MNESTSYLSADEVQAAQVLHRRAPYSLTGISKGYFSTARYYGGLTYMACAYIYIPGHDECVRDDVLQLVTRLRKAAAKEAAKAAKAALL